MSMDIRKRRKHRGSRSPVLIVGFVLVLLFVCLVGYGFLWRLRHDSASPVERALGSAVTWFQTGFSRLEGGVISLLRGPYWNEKTVEEYLGLRQEVVSLRSKVDADEQLRQENSRLLDLLDAKEEAEDLDTVFARVINREQNAFTGVLVLDRGSSDGIQVDMAVISADGLVGRVTEVGSTWCRVTCVISNDSNVPAFVESTRDPGIVAGNLAQSDPEKLLILDYLPENATVAPGDRIFTSGMGGIYPKGILIGEVSGVERGNGTYKTISLEPATDFVHIEEVLIVTQMQQQVPLGEAVQQ